MKNEILEKREEINEYYDAYGELLTDKQKSLFEDYYLHDLSLGEIAEDRGITRSAVNDALKKTVTKFEEYEKAVGLLKLKKDIKSLLKEIEEASTKEEKDKAIERLKEYGYGI